VSARAATVVGRMPTRTVDDLLLDYGDIPVARIPETARLWSRALVIAWGLFAVFLLDRISLLLLDFWLFESLGFESVFWTNFRMGALIAVVVFALFAAAAIVPAFVHPLTRAVRRRMVSLGFLVAVLAVVVYAGHYLEFLMLRDGQPFGESDPVFGHDFSFYIFSLPAIETIIGAVMWAAFVGLVSSALCGWIARPGTSREPGQSGLGYFVARIMTPFSIAMLALWGTALAFRVWIHRYDVLVRDNTDSSIPSGAEALDITGFFSTVNGYTVTALAVFFGVVALSLRLLALHRSVTADDEGISWRKIGIVSLAMTLLPGLAIDSAFKAMVAFRNATQITPNEPVVQLPFIDRHIKATNKAYGLENVEEIDFTPKDVDDPKPEIGELLDHPSVKNTQLWPGFVSSLENLLDPEYVDRLFYEGEDFKTILGTTLHRYQQQEKLRPYYDFLDVDTLRYDIDGEPTLFASSVRELPLIEPQPWLAWWGQRYVLFTHGHGLVMNRVSEANDDGNPIYWSTGVPPRVLDDALEVDENSIYYGEGSGSIAFSNLTNIDEFDFPTDQGRAEIQYPQDIQAGTRLDSFLKRLVFGWKARSFFDIVFSDLIRSDARVHFLRTPLERVERLAPFLHTDNDPYAAVTDGRINWMINGMTYTDHYPYSAMGELGDKSVRRSFTVGPLRNVNYVKDAVKVAIDAYTGDTKLYKWTDEPIINTWDSIYPDLFEPADAMPDAVREQVQYPIQLFHIQFDDVYIYTHMKEPIEFFNQEDAYDDSDEVLGAMVDEGAPITFSFEPYHWIAETGKDLPAADQESQFALSMAFTPEGALNLRAIATAYQDGDDYGKLSLLLVPKGHFYNGPEQAEAAIDQDAFISQEIGFWNRVGAQVIRGHMTPLVIDGEVLYVEPLFISSAQNPAPQLQRVIVVFRGTPYIANNIQNALRLAISGVRREGSAAVAGETDEQTGAGPPAGTPIGEAP
jgi:uncharacterized membrane protein (UPF0182 family)